MVLIREYLVKTPNEKGIKHWVSFGYNASLIEKIKRIPSPFRVWDSNTKMWGFNDKGWSLFCAISEVQFKDEAFGQIEEPAYLPRKISNKLENVDWNKFYRPADDKYDYELNLWDFQKLGISRIIREKNCGIFFSMGLGKTYTTICLAKELLDRKEIKQCLIISLVGGVLKQWAELLDRMGYSYTIIKEDKMVDRPRIYANTNTDFVLTLYTSVLSKGKVGRAKARKFSQVFRIKQEKGNQMIVADELHKLGDVSSKTFREFLMMSKSTKYRIPLTGTIIKSTPDKALLPLRFIDPKTFSNKGVFEEAFMVKEEGKFGSKVVGYKNLTRLKELIHTYGVVALKKDYLPNLPELLPPKKIIVETSKDSREVLRSLRGDETLRLIQNKSDVDYVKLQDLYIRVHQALICPHVFSDKFLAKNMLEAVISILDSIEGKTIIFTTLIEAVEEISNYLNKYSIKNVKCSGRYDDPVISKRVDDFISDEDIKVMVATVQKMGTGYDKLKIAQNCIIYDFNMVAGDMMQAIDRLHRSGQKNKVSVFELVQDNVFSELQREKVKTQQNIIYQTSDAAVKAKDTVDLTKLLKLALESNLFKG